MNDGMGSRKCREMINSWEVVGVIWVILPTSAKDQGFCLMSQKNISRRLSLVKKAGNEVSNV